MKLLAERKRTNASPGFLVQFESEVLRRAQKNFSFRNGRCVELMIWKA